MKMPYKISGYLQNSDVRIVVIKESDWSVEKTEVVSIGDYEVRGLTYGKKIILAVKSDGETEGFGNVDSLDEGYVAVFPGGRMSPGVDVNTIDYVSFISPNNAVDFGDLTKTIHYLSATSNRTNDKAVCGGGSSGAANNGELEHFTISTTGDASIFGNLNNNIYASDATSNGTSERGLWISGWTSFPINNIDYITISTPGNATDFGDITTQRCALSATSNMTRAVAFGGYNGAVPNVIDYVTISTTGNATDFGDTITDRRNTKATSNATNDRGVFVGGGDATMAAVYNIIEYLTLSSSGNSTDFGDLTRQSLPAATSNGEGERALVAAGTGPIPHQDMIDYFTISTLSNAIDFGDVTVARAAASGTSNA